MIPTLLIVDDEKHTREGLRTGLEDAFDVYIAADIAGAISVLEREHVDVLLTDLRIGAEDGMQLVEWALARSPRPVVVMMTAYGSVDTAVEAMRRGAYDFVTKPVNIDRLELLLQRALRSRDTEKEVVELKKQVEKRFGLERFVGDSACMQEVYDTLRQVAPTRATVLIQGESGTGKELAAQALHSLSDRSKAKFVAIHCAALSPQLLESELFGHEKGAFTGAAERRIGRFEQANGGTLFLDEIGEIDSATQVKLLRVLGEERSFERVGGNSTIKVDVRLVTATNRDLAKMVEEGKFREDLYFRLSVVPLVMPPLRERKSDLPVLVQAFLKLFSTENSKPLRELTTEAMQAILRHDWPGNVRELRTVIEHGVVMASGPKITLRDLPVALRGGISGKANAASPSLSPAKVREDRLNLNHLEDCTISQALSETKGNVTQAARRLGMSRRTLHRRLKEMRSEGGDAVLQEK